MITLTCPKCACELQCEEALLGTPGECKACGHVFTTSTETHLGDQEPKVESLVFACPKCKARFFGNADFEGKKGKCIACANIFLIERYQPPELAAPKAKSPALTVVRSAGGGNPAGVNRNIRKGASQPKAGHVTSKPTKLAVDPQRINQPPVPTKRRPDTHVEGYQSLSELNLADLLPPVSFEPTTPTYSRPKNPNPGPSESFYTGQASSVYSQPLGPMRRKVRSKSGSRAKSAKFSILRILGAVTGILMLAGCGGLLTFMLYASSSKTISAGGYSARAPGLTGKGTSGLGNALGEVAMNPRTYSTFLIGVVHPLEPNQTMNPEKYIAGIDRAGYLRTRSKIARAGLQGIHYESTNGLSVPAHTAEVFSLGDSVLIMMYINGKDNPKARLGSIKKYTLEQIVARDHPDSFFASLRQN